jgi:peptidase A4-like protein
MSRNDKEFPDDYRNTAHPHRRARHRVRPGRTRGGGWYEMVPKGTVYRGYYSHPGDLISLSVSYNYSNHQYSPVYDDKTNAASTFSIPAVCPAKSTCKNLDAEAIMEAAGGTNVSKFSKLTFSDIAISTRSGKRGAFGGTSVWTLTESFMQHTSVSRTSAGGSAFSISYS